MTEHEEDVFWLTWGLISVELAVYAVLLYDHFSYYWA